MPFGLRAKKGVKKSSDLDVEIDQLIEDINTLSTNKSKSSNMEDDEGAVSTFDVSANSDGENDLCGHCKMKVENGIQCHDCLRWYHYDGACSGVPNAENMNLECKYIYYICPGCYDANESSGGNLNNKSWNKLMNLDANIKDMQVSMTNQLDVFRQILLAEFGNMYDELKTMKKRVEQFEHSETKDSYASALKKNTLVIKSMESTKTAAECKKDIMEKISTNVEQVKTSKQGHLLVNFANESRLEAAKDNLDKMKNSMNVTVDKKDMLKPKIQVCDIDVDEDSIIETIKEKNQWICNLIKEEDDFKLLKKKKSRQENKEHVIIKCSPEIRQAIQQNYDRLYTTYGRCKVYDSYMVYQCYKCQEFGHSADRCKNAQVCAKCSGNHKTKDCSEGTSRCKNCIRNGHEDIDHKAFDSRCPVYMEEVTRIKNKTDHGF